MADPWFAYVSNEGSFVVVELTELMVYKMKYDLPSVSHLRMVIPPFQARDRDEAWLCIKEKLAARDVLKRLIK